MAAQDYEFVITNKVTHIINTSGLQIRNYWESIGVKYLTFDWVDQDCQVILDSSNTNANKIYNFIEETCEQGESCLVHSVRGQSRASTVLAAYFMKKFKWSLYKTIEFLNNRRPDLEIRASFIRQLSYYEKRLLHETGVQSDAWTELASKPHLENEELILTHTFLNAQMGPFADFSKSESMKSLKDNSKLKWIDQRESRKNLLVTNDSKDDLVHKNHVQRVRSHYDSKAEKSIIKVPYDQFYLNNRFDSDEGEEPLDKQLLTMDAKSDEEAKVMSKSIERTNKEHSKSTKQQDIDSKEPDHPHISKQQKDKIVKPFDYGSLKEPLKVKEELRKQKIVDDKSKVKNNYADNDYNSPATTALHLNVGQTKDNSIKFRPNIKKDSIKLKKNKTLNTSSEIKRQKSKDGKKKRRPRSNDDRSKDKTLNYFDKTNTRKPASRGSSEKNAKDIITSDEIQKRSIVNKFINNAQELIDKTAKIDSRNIYASNNNNNQK